MPHARLAGTVAAAALLACGPFSFAQPTSPVCLLALEDERVELEDARLEVELERSKFAAYLKVFEMIDRLWEENAVERMVYVKSKYDRDSAELAFEQADLILARQSALIDAYTLACDAGDSRPNSEERSRKIEEAHRRYLKANCDAQSKAIEVAEVNLAFNREWLASIRDLREGAVATRTMVILAELDVEREEKHLADAKRRVEVCKR
jgi:hypothetical protein